MIKYAAPAAPDEVRATDDEAEFLSLGGPRYSFYFTLAEQLRGYLTRENVAVAAAETFKTCPEAWRTPVVDSYGEWQWSAPDRDLLAVLDEMRPINQTASPRFPEVACRIEKVSRLDAPGGFEPVRFTVVSDLSALGTGGHSLGLHYHHAAGDGLAMVALGMHVLDRCLDPTRRPVPDKSRSLSHPAAGWLAEPKPVVNVTASTAVPTILLRDQAQRHGWTVNQLLIAMTVRALPSIAQLLPASQDRIVLGIPINTAKHDRLAGISLASGRIALSDLAHLSSLDLDEIGEELQSFRLNQTGSGYPDMYITNLGDLSSQTPASLRTDTTFTGVRHSPFNLMPTLGVASLAGKTSLTLYATQRESPPIQAAHDFLDALCVQIDGILE